MKPCERCPAPALPGERFCKACKALVLSDMKASGYLAPKPSYGAYRPADAREDVRSTKHGRDG